MIAAATETVGLVQQFVERTGQLYSLPAVAAEVLRITGEPQVDPQALRQCIESDPALVARLLRAANSSLIGPARPVTDLNQALTLLGIRPLKMLVLGFSLPKELFAGLEATVLERDWRQTLVKAVAAREIAECFWQLPGDEAFLAGLVQDIGLLALIQQLGPSYQRLLDHVQSVGGSLIACELDTLGFDHLVLSARLLSHWGLPAELCAAISVPPAQERIEELSAKERVLPQILHLAELVARLIDQPYGNALAELLAAGEAYCNLKYERLQPIVSTLQCKVVELADVLSLQLPDDHSYVDLLLAAQKRLADETMNALSALPRSEPGEELVALQADLRQQVQLASSRNPARARNHASGRHSPPREDSWATAAVVVPGDIVSRGRSIDDLHSGERELSSCLAAAVQRSRQSRTPLTLALVEMDDFNDLLLQAGPGAITELMYSLRESLPDGRGERDTALLVSDSRLAIVWEDCTRSEGVQRARDCLVVAGDLSRWHLRLGRDVTLSIGLATLEAAPKNYPCRELIEAAQRCLSGAQLSGGNTVKSLLSQAM